MKKVSNFTRDFADKSFLNDNYCMKDYVKSKVLVLLQILCLGVLWGTVTILSIIELTK